MEKWKYIQRRNSRLVWKALLAVYLACGGISPPLDVLVILCAALSILWDLTAASK
jgi:hypothetical protein